MSPVYSPFHGVEMKLGFKSVPAHSYVFAEPCKKAMTEVTDLEWRGVLRLRQTSVKFSEAISYCFIPFRIKSQGCQSHRQKTASGEKKNTPPNVL